MNKKYLLVKMSRRFFSSEYAIHNFKSAYVVASFPIWLIAIAALLLHPRKEVYDSFNSNHPKN